MVTILNFLTVIVHDCSYILLILRTLQKVLPSGSELCYVYWRLLSYSVTDLHLSLLFLTYTNCECPRFTSFSSVHMFFHVKHTKVANTSSSFLFFLNTTISSLITDGTSLPSILSCILSDDLWPLQESQTHNQCTYIWIHPTSQTRLPRLCRTRHKPELITLIIQIRF